MEIFDSRWQPIAVGRVPESLTGLLMNTATGHSTTPFGVMKTIRGREQKFSSVRKYTTRHVHVNQYRKFAHGLDPLEHLVRGPNAGCQTGGRF